MYQLVLLALDGIDMLRRLLTGYNYNRETLTCCDLYYWPWVELISMLRRLSTRTPQRASEILNNELIMEVQ
jgi:hypothetical protein